MLRLSILVCLVALLAAGCDTGGDAIGITGDWEGELTGQEGTYPITVTFRDTGLQVTGAGTVQLPDDPFAFSVTGGTFESGVASLDLRFEVVPPTGRLIATLTQAEPGVLEGTFQGVGLANGNVRIELVSR